MTALPAVPAGRFAIAAVLMLAACRTDELLNGPDALDDDVLHVSGIVYLPAPEVSPSGASAQLVEGEVAYVSLAPGTVPDGTDADIRNRSNGIGTTVTLIDGGFDPIPIPGQEGDTIDVTARDAQGKSYDYTGLIKARPPVVVRTSPTRGQTDVAFSFVILVVFNQPMSPLTVTGETVQLLKDDQIVPGSVTLRDDGIEAELTPDQGLEPATTYTVVVTRSARSVAGDPLKEELRYEFSTTVLPPAFVVGISPGVDTLEAGSRLTVSVGVWNANTSDSITGISVRWRSSNPSIAVVDGSGNVQSVAAGDVQVIADVEGVGPFPSRLTFTSVRFTAVTAGDGHTCALAQSGTALCWGENASGQLGTGDTRTTLVPVQVVGGQRFVTIAAGAEHTCGLTPEGQALCWGSDRRWQLGRLDNQPSDAPAERLTPTAVPGGLSLVAIDGGAGHGCAVTSTAGGICWGDYAYTDGRLLLDGPKALRGGSAFQVISSGSEHDCGLVAGAAWCWGRNDRGQLGDGTTVSHPTLAAALDTTTEIAPRAVTGGRAYQAVAAGGRHTCALSGGTAYCWGDNAFGQLGRGQISSTALPEPVPVATGVDFSDLSSGSSHTCGVTLGGTGYCWGRNDSGQLGNGSREQRGAPVAVSGGLTFTSISAGSDHACGVTSDGLLYCWGQGDRGQLGNGYTGVYDRPTKVSLQR